MNQMSELPNICSEHWQKLKEETGNIVTTDFDVPVSITDKTTKQKDNKETGDLNTTVS